MIIEVNATVTYTCYLDDKQAELVKKYAKEHKSDWGELTLEEAVEELYSDDKLDLYKNSTESDFATEEILSVKDKEEEE